MNETKNFHAISVKYLPCTNTKGSRFKMYSGRFKDSVTVAYNYSLNHVNDMAIEWLSQHGQSVLGQAEIKSGAIILLDSQNNTFMSLKDMKKREERHKIRIKKYKCIDCDNEIEAKTNHYMEIYPVCKGKCRQILNPHTENEIVLPVQTTHIPV